MKTSTTMPILIHIFPRKLRAFLEFFYTCTATAFGASVSHEICPKIISNHPA